MKVVFYASAQDNEAKAADVTWEALAKDLLDIERTPCAPCQGRSCPSKNTIAWSPIELSPPTRKSEHVTAITALVYDLDHVSDGEIQAMALALEPYTYAVHSTHSHGTDGRSTGKESGTNCLRLVLPLAEPVTRGQRTHEAFRDYWRQLRAATALHLQIPTDTRDDGKDLSRLFFMPTLRAGADAISERNEGKLLEIAQTVAPRSSNGRTADSESVKWAFESLPGNTEDLSAARKKLLNIRNEKTRGLLKSMLSGEPFAAEGERDATINKLAGSIVFACPKLSTESMLELMRPGLFALPGTEGGEHWLKEAKDCIERAKVRYAETKANEDQAAQRIRASFDRVRVGGLSGSPKSSDQRAERVTNENPETAKGDNPSIAYFVPLQAYIYADRRGRWQLSSPVGRKAIVLQLVSRGMAMDEIDDLLNTAAFPIAQGVACAASKSMLIDRDGDTFLNSYIAPTLVPNQGTWPTIRKILDHITAGDPSGVNWLLNWIAFKVQNPTSRNMTAVVLGSAIHGTGKGTLGTVISQMIGEENCATVGQNETRSDFNSMYAHKLFIQANEVFTSETMYDRSGTFKAMISDPLVTVNQKGIRQYAIDNCMTWFFTSNNTTPVRVEAGDRRYSVFTSAGTLSPDYRALINGVYTVNGGFTLAFLEEVSAFYFDILAWKVDEALVKLPYQNESRDDLIELSKNSTQVFFDMVAAVGVDSLMNAFTRKDWDFGDLGVERTAVYKAYRDFCDTSGYPMPVSLTKFTQEMKRQHPDWLVARGPIIAGKRPYVYRGIARTKAEGEPLVN